MSRQLHEPPGAWWYWRKAIREWIVPGVALTIVAVFIATGWPLR